MIILVVVFPVIAPGFIVQFPEGNPVNSTFPVDTVHVGCVIELTTGAVGVMGCALIVTFCDAADVQP